MTHPFITQSKLNSKLTSKYEQIKKYETTLTMRFESAKGVMNFEQEYIVINPGSFKDFSKSYLLLKHTTQFVTIILTNTIQF